MRLRGGLAVLWHGATQVRIGTDPRWAVTLADLSPAAARALRTAPMGADERTLRRGFEGEHVPQSEVDAVLGHLRSAHLLVDGASNDSPDTTAWGLVRADGDGAAVLERRARARVRVCGLGRLGAGLALTLAKAGVGRIELDDDVPVTVHDAGWAGLGPTDVGVSRAVAVGRAVREAAPRVRTAWPGIGRVDLVVLVEHGTADPLRYRPLLAAGVAHLSVVIREASVLIGPLVVPGTTACLRCVDLHRADLDADWPAVAAQLAVGAGSPSRGEETTLASVAAALAAAQVIAQVDGRPSTVRDAALEVALPDVLPRRLSWAPHPRCGCTAPPE